MFARWIDGKMGKWKDERKDKRWVDIYIDGLMGSWRMDEWLDEQSVYEWIEGGMERTATMKETLPMKEQD